MAGIGEKPTTRSGPCVFTVWTVEAAMISSASSQVARRKPPLPRACWQRARASGSSTSEAQAATGSACAARAARQRSMSAPRTYGYFTRSGL